ncbi:hypothetical protein AKJ51_00380 [candidate division MSBL1 archaeon SCGC-AAA382A20]|uniref:Phosphoglycolate phosphatase n=1 Tax=candidate division MSBL1 archaeon SCGC-AAA382A20 TaxID=1698280 RepID=A0A133VMM7_9EURY|nr:hypothetical protein AKJ51_00380 [candidate division MSBL1 archaeon SCGC-AAA382A20]
MKMELKGEKRDIEAIIFDMDNTLFDFVEAKMKACRKVTESVGVNDGTELFNYFLRDGVGFEDVECIADYLRDRSIYEEVTYRQCCDIYEKTKLENIETYDGVRETLQFLEKKGFGLALVTNADRKNLDARLEKADLSHFFDTTVSSEETGKAKPDLSPLLLALDELGMEAPETLKVGDSLTRDISPAKKLGMITAYAEYGDKNLEKEEDLEPDYKLKDIKDLIPLLRENINRFSKG